MAGTDKLPIIFLDRDGTIIVDKVYLNEPDGVEFIDGVKEGLKKLFSLGFKLVIVTNQSGIARGLVKIENLNLIHEKIQQELKSEGIDIFKIYYCPHLPQDNCDCRKPKLGMIKEIEHLIDKRRSFVVGDKETDVEFGKNLGVKTILITKAQDNIIKADYVASSFKEVVDFIIRCTF